MDAFLERHRSRIIGTLSGFDRILFRGTLRSISYVAGMGRFLGANGGRYTQFSQFVQKLSGRLKTHAKQLAEKHGRPFIYLESSSLNKEDQARRIMQQDGVKAG